MATVCCHLGCGNLGPSVPSGGQSRDTLKHDNKYDNIYITTYRYILGRVNVLTFCSK